MIDSRSPLPLRLLAYTNERFPLVPSAMTAAFLALSADATADAAAGSGALPLDLVSVVTTVTILVALFALRVADEHKDLEADGAAYPDRPLQRGLVRLRELVAPAGARATHIQPSSPISKSRPRSRPPQNQKIPAHHVLDRTGSSCSPCSSSALSQANFRLLPVQVFVIVARVYVILVDIIITFLL